MKNKNAVIAIAVVAVLLIGGIALYWNLTHGNRQLFDTKYRFNYAIIRLPNGEVVEGKVTSWLDFDQSDTVQITMDGKTYLTHYMNVCLINEYREGGVASLHHHQHAGKRKVLRGFVAAEVLHGGLPHSQNREE